MAGYTNGKRDIVKKMKNELAQLDLTQKQIEKVIDVYLETIRTELEKGNAVTIPRIGRLEVLEVEKEKHFNPFTNEYDDRKVVYNRIAFKSSKALRARLNKKEDEE